MSKHSAAVLLKFLHDIEIGEIKENDMNTTTIVKYLMKDKSFLYSCYERIEVDATGEKLTGVRLVPFEELPAAIQERIAILDAVGDGIQVKDVGKRREMSMLDGHVYMLDITGE